MLFYVFREGFHLQTLIFYCVSSFFVIFLTLPIHEFGHAYTAVKLGDPTPRYQGRLTLNPFAHIDYIGALMILLIGFGWAKPVQINSRNFRSPKRDMAISAFAGPLANLIMAFVFLVLIHALSLFQSNAVLNVILSIFSYIVLINIGLAVFNLLPIPPLDGSRLLGALLPDRIYYRLMQYERYAFILILALFWLGALDQPMRFLQNGLLSSLDFLAGLPFRPFSRIV